jgi:hypothetical protein|nr:hypothetical protein [Neorhizobium tomejilense]
MPITRKNLPALEGPTFQDAKNWLAKLRPHESGVYFGGQHADDTVEAVAGIEPDAAAEINSIRKQIFANARNWADSEVIYDLWAGKTVEAERFWPGFVNDVWTSGSRTGYVSVRGRTLPNYVIEEFSGEFFLLEFDRIGPVSECPSFKLSLLAGVKFNPTSSSGYIDTSAASIVEGTTVEFGDIASVDSVIESIHDEDLAPRPKPMRP